MADTPRDQVLLDLDGLNHDGVLDNGEVPLREWLLNASVLAGPHSSAQVFELALAQLKEVLPPFEPPTKAEPVVSLMAPISAYVSLAKEDLSILETLAVHLSALIRANWLSLSHRYQSPPSSLAHADLVLVIATPAYLSTSRTLDEAARLSSLPDVRVVPLLAKPLDWRSSPLRSHPLVPASGSPLVLDNRAYGEAALAIRAIVSEMLERRRRTDKA